MSLLVAPWTGPYGGVPPWDQARAARFPEAFALALAQERSEIEAIAGNPAAPTFDNTIAALERAGQARDRVTRMFLVLRENIGTPEIQSLDLEWQPKLAAADDAVVFNPVLFQRIEDIHRLLPTAGLTPEQARLTTLTYDAFIRKGARLGEADKARLGEINQALETLYSEFRAKVLADEDTWTVLESERDLAGLPASEISAARAAANERGLSGNWAIVNTRSSVDPFLTFSSNQALRERVWRRFKSRGDNGDANDTKRVIAAIVEKRADRAALLGFPSHAHWQLSDTMARTPERARELMLQVWKAAVARVSEEVAEMQDIAAAEGASTTIEPWDYLYYGEKVRKAKYDLDQSALKPYFELNNMVSAVLWSAEQRFNLRFLEISGQIPVFHPDVRVFEVLDAPSGAHRGLFYLDNFARTGKRSGAWAGSYRMQHKMDGGATPIVSNNNNFLKGTAGEPALISLDDATTLFHEFGHALHDLLQDVTYPGLSDTPMDFVELPSQVNECWLMTPEVLDNFARHYQTGEPMPRALIEKVTQSETFNQGYTTVEAVSDALLDMELHTRPDGRFEPGEFERTELQRIGMPREIALRHRLPHFDHLFGGDAYSAAYYSYLWSDVMAADAWQAFSENGGPWDKSLNDRMREHIWSSGNSTDRAEAYRRFRGRDPEVTALLERRGLQPVVQKG